MSWKSDDLLNKATVYFQRAFMLDRENELFPLWCSLGLELLARAALSRIHPALLADPQQGENLLYAFGFPSGNPPKSIPAKTLFHRLTVVIPLFKEDDFKFCTSLMELRNAELHSAELAFENYPVSKWLPNLFRICKILTEFCNLKLEDILGEEEATSANEIIAASQAKLQQEVNNLINNAKNVFLKQALEIRLQKATEAKKEILKHLDWKSSRRECPACGAHGAIQGAVVKFLEPKATTDSIEERAIIMPISFVCVCCGLNLPSHQHLFNAGMGDQYTESNLVDPKDYYGIEFDRSDYCEGDYGND
jgi:hypothetical protein